jgi:hypothetical protein
MALSGFNHSVNWNEFRNVNQRPAGTPEDAFIRTNFTSNFSLYQTGDEDCVVTSATVGIRIDRGRTWVVRGRTSADLLRHEQGHYNITALGAREYYTLLLELTAAHCSNINSQAQTLRQQIQTHIDETDIRYDNLTANGTNQSVQRTWDTRIRSTMQRPDGTLYDLP